MNQCWFTIKWVLYYPESDFTRCAHEFKLKYVIRSYSSLITATSPRGHWVNLMQWYFTVGLWCPVASWICSWVNIASGNGLLPDDIKPLLEQMLTRCHYLYSTCIQLICNWDQNTRISFKKLNKKLLSVNISHFILASTHWDPDKMAHVAGAHFKWISWKKRFVFQLKLH